MSKIRWVVGAVVAAAVLVSAGTFVYIHFVEKKAPPPLSFSNETTTSTTDPPAGAGDTTTTAAVPTGSVDGTWQVASSGSTVGYRVHETLFGQSNTATGRTTKVTGSLTISGTTVSDVSLSADMTSVASDQDRRDQQFQGRIMETSQFPTATFKLTKPITLASIPTDSAIMTVSATGDLTLHGTTKSVTFSLQARRRGANIEVTGQIPIVFADYNISNPSFAGTVTTDDHGILEFLVVFSK